jgi:hypothetical protein
LRKNKTISDSKINQFLKTYKGTIYQTTEESSSQRRDNKDLEMQKIIDSLIKQSKIENTTPGNKLNADDK